MMQIEIFDIPSPCLGVCESDNKGYCKGCFRNREERFHWNLFSNEQKKEIIRLCRLRKIKQKISQDQRQTFSEKDDLMVQDDLFES